MTKEEHPVSDLLIEASNAAATLILKRRKLFRHGGSVFVALLKKVEGHSWLKASMPVADISRNGWDLAHETAARYKKELGSAPYIEPDKVGGRYDRLSTLGREQSSDQHATKSAFATAGAFDPQSIVNGMLPNNGQFGLPGGFSVPGMNSGLGGFGAAGGFGGGTGGFGLPAGMDPFAAAGFGRRGSAMPGDAPNKEIIDILKGTGLGDEAKEIAVPAMREVPGWERLAANTARMMEVEAAQLLLSQMPGVAPELHSKESLRAVADLEACSKVLRRFLEVLPKAGSSEESVPSADSVSTNN